MPRIEWQTAFYHLSDNCQEFPSFITARAVQTEHMAMIAVLILIEGHPEANARLNRHVTAGPSDFTGLGNKDH
jgi:hypothetical protein